MIEPIYLTSSITNLFLPADVHKKELHKIHFDAKEGLKAFIIADQNRFKDENINDAKSTDITANVYKSKIKKGDQPEYEECLSCQ